MAQDEIGGTGRESGPARAEWNPRPGPGRCGRFLMRLAGVDLNLALEMPLDEQRMMQRVAGAALVGCGFQFFCIVAASYTVAGFTVATVILAILIAGVLFLFDLAFIGADWTAQGLALCRANGVTSDGGRFEKFKRPLAIGARWLLSFLAATIIAQLLLMNIFGADIDRYWAADRRSRNAPTVAIVTDHYASLVTDLAQRTARSEKLIADLKRERTELSSAPRSNSQIDGEISDLLNLQKRLEKERLEAELISSREATDATAEQYGVRIRADNTGLSGRGNHFSFHQSQAAQQRAIALTRTQEAETVRRRVEALQLQRAADVAELSARNQSRLEIVERRLQLEQTSLSELSAERRHLEDGREAWIDSHVRQSAGYVSPPVGLLARLDGLLAIIKSSSALAGFVVLLKAMIMMIELAGPITKALLTPPTVYSMTVALRVIDAAGLEADRRSSWRHWRLLAASRREEETEVIDINRRRRAAVSQASREVRDLFENIAAKGN
jgi:hypothetical protein